jgi:hypothetical protein
MRTSTHKSNIGYLCKLTTNLHTYVLRKYGADYVANRLRENALPPLGGNCFSERRRAYRLVEYAPRICDDGHVSE